MCGIIGYAGTRDAGPILLSGLKALEYRGYDSAGVASVCGNGIQVRKDAGRVDDIEGRLFFSQLPGNAGIGHTRWATHGSASKENSHPHVSCEGKIAVVHNGIIENFDELKLRLMDAGHHFVSQTDTEVIPHLIEEEYHKGVSAEEAVRSACSQLKGEFAILVLFLDHPDKIIAVRKDSPLVLGLADHGVFVASDSTPFLPHTRKAVFINDGEMVVVNAGGYGFFDLQTGKPVLKTPSEIGWTAEQAQKSGFSHFMLKEIFEQSAAMRNALSQDSVRLQAFADELKNTQKIIIATCGTSRHAALVGKHVFNRLAGKQVEVLIASEFSYFAEKVSPDTLILAISQSGETADVLDGVKKAKKNGCRIFSIVNVVGSTLDRLSELSLHLNCGPEIGVAATKSFVNQLTLFYLLAFAMTGKAKEGAKQLNALSYEIEQLIADSNGRMRNLALKIKNRQHAFFIGRGVNFPIALEGALKLKEISYIHAEGMPAGEMKHGTIALIEEGTPVFALNPTDYTYYDTFGNSLETKARGAFLIGVGNKNNSAYAEFVALPEAKNDLFYPFLETIPLQLLAYHAAVELGLDPDKPRNLAKSVTVK
ncbi:MAG: glutamine--fructose-6-phosphate transaminase (isomerizing) [Candidatus Micrarchaeota archaeon]